MASHAAFSLQGKDTASPSFVAYRVGSRASSRTIITPFGPPVLNFT
jgi:hypothetical protein